MKIKILTMGKTREDYLKSGLDVYLKRLKHYVSLDLIWLPDVKRFGNRNDLLKKEADVFLAKINDRDKVCLLDEKGKLLSSVNHAQYLENHQVRGTNTLVYVIGGAYGFDAKMYDRADFMMSLSKMTFSHQMIRLFLVEQIYRAFTILRNEKYHNP